MVCSGVSCVPLWPFRGFVSSDCFNNNKISFSFFLYILPQVAVKFPRGYCAIWYYNKLKAEANMRIQLSSIKSDVKWFAKPYSQCHSPYKNFFEGWETIALFHWRKCSLCYCVMNLFFFKLIAVFQFLSLNLFFPRLLLGHYSCTWSRDLLVHIGTCTPYNNIIWPIKFLGISPFPSSSLPQSFQF